MIKVDLHVTKPHIYLSSLVWYQLMGEGERIDATADKAFHSTPVSGDGERVLCVYKPILPLTTMASTSKAL